MKGKEAGNSIQNGTDENRWTQRHETKVNLILDKNTNGECVYIKAACMRFNDCFFFSFLLMGFPACFPASFDMRRARLGLTRPRPCVSPNT